MVQFKNHVEDKSIIVGGKQHILAKDNYMIPITIKNGLQRVTLRPCTHRKLVTLPHPVLTSDVDWDPACLGSTGGAGNAIFYDSQSSVHKGPSDPRFNKFGEFRDVKK